MTVKDWPSSGWQIDANFVREMMHLAFASPHYGSSIFESEIKSYGHQWFEQGEVRNEVEATMEPITISRKDQLGDGIMTAITLAP
ncbi:MAG: hypothetical protein IPK15_03900 [Verrucomicrobia bacterium]|nr:hypothetical protein [Verrucomicrobiota bacterium]